MTMPPAWSFAADEVIVLARETDVVYVQVRARNFARAARIPPRAQWAYAIVASELASNVLKYGSTGSITLRGRMAPRPFVEIETVDAGRGIGDVEHALRDGISDGVDHAKNGTPRHERRGLGLGLGAVQRLSDSLRIAPRADGGTLVVARFDLAWP
jgi:serine/threonine-protein kinase RsbT